MSGRGINISVQHGDDLLRLHVARGVLQVLVAVRVNQGDLQDGLEAGALLRRRGAVVAPEFGEENVRLAVAFREVRFELGAAPPFSAPLGWINDGKGPEGWLDTTYLDEDMLIYKQNDPGGYFVLTKVEDCDP